MRMCMYIHIHITLAPIMYMYVINAYVVTPTLYGYGASGGHSPSMHFSRGCVQASAFPLWSAANPHHYILRIYSSI